MAGKRFDVIGIGHILVDMLVRAEESLLTELKLKKGHFTLVDEQRMQEISRHIQGLTAEMAAGGSVPNTIAGIAYLGGSAGFVGKVGDDAFGEFLREGCIAQGMHHRMPKMGRLTGRAIGFITPDSERTFATHLGASCHITKGDIVEEDIRDSKVLHLSGYELESRELRETCIHAMDIAQRHKVRISIDLADPGVIGRNKADLDGIVRKYADIVFLNEEEAAAFTGLPAEQAVVALGEYAEIAVLKRGKEGSLINDHGAIIMIAGVQANAVDTTGAGDMYAAAILYGITHDMPLEEAGNLASRMAAKVVEQVGARLRKIS